MKIKDTDIHHHLRARMLQRGIGKEEIEITINKGWSTGGAKEGTIGKTSFTRRRKLPFIIK